VGLADRLARLNAACQLHLGEDVPATYTPPGGSPIALNGIYIRRPIDVVVDDDIVASLEHRYDVLEADLPDAPRRGATLTIRGESHEVKGAEGPDDSGWVRLMLKIPD